MQISISINIIRNDDEKISDENVYNNLSLHL